MANKDDKKKREGKASKLLTGVIIGGAIGSVLGVTLSDKENRDLVKKKTLETWEKSRILLGETIKEQSKKHKKKGVWHTLNKIFFGKKK